MKKVVALYPGRFQPFTVNHFNAYNLLKKNFDDVLILTSDKVEENSPFNFEEKKQIISGLYGIPENKIIKIKKPYGPEEVLEKYKDSNNSYFVTVLGEKDDQDRFQGRAYIKRVKNKQDVLSSDEVKNDKIAKFPMSDETNVKKVGEENLKKAMIFVVPNQYEKYEDQWINGSLLRKYFSNENLTQDELKHFISVALNQSKEDMLKNKNIINMITKKLGGTILENKSSFKSYFKESKELLKEGGNVFSGKTDKIQKEFIQPTLEMYFSELSSIFPKKKNIFNLKHFHTLGSVGKKDYSGDIDLGVDISVLLDKEVSDKSLEDWNLNPEDVRNEFLDLKKRAKTSSDDQLMAKAFLKHLTIYINKNAKNLYCDEKKVTPGNIFGLYPQFDENKNKLDVGVQIDWMVGDIEWLKFSYYSSAYPKESNVKGLHRTQLLLAAFQVANASFNHVSGLKDKDSNEVIASKPEDALNILSDRLGFKVNDKVTENYYSLHKFFKEKMKKEDYSKLLDIYFKILDSTRADIPDDMQKDWIERKDKLSLTGKFLPQDSKLLKEI